jgi:hypothetical protein
MPPAVSANVKLIFTGRGYVYGIIIIGASIIVEQT